MRTSLRVLPAEDQTLRRRQTGLGHVCPLPAFHKVLLGHSHSPHSRITRGCFRAAVGVGQWWQKEQDPRGRYFLCGLLQRAAQA